MAIIVMGHFKYHHTIESSLRGSLSFSNKSLPFLAQRCQFNQEQRKAPEEQFI